MKTWGGVFGAILFVPSSLAASEQPASPQFQTGRLISSIVCAQSQDGQKEEALASLKKTISLGLKDAQRVKTDPALVSLRETDEYKQLAADADAAK